MVDQQLLSHQFQQTLGKLPDVKLVYLFGSRVQGAIGPMSDFDFGILFDDGQDRLLASARLAHELAEALGASPVDVVSLNDSPIELAYAVISRGRLLFARDAVTRVEYEAQIMSRYGDYLPILRAQRDNLLAEEDYDARIQRYRVAFGRTERALGQIATTAK